MAKRVVVIGTNGQLGTDLVKVMGDWDFVPLTHSEPDICDFVYTRKVLEDKKPEIVINTAAFNSTSSSESRVFTGSLGRGPKGATFKAYLEEKGHCRDRGSGCLGGA